MLKCTLVSDEYFQISYIFNQYFAQTLRTQFGFSISDRNFKMSQGIYFLFID